EAEIKGEVSASAIQEAMRHVLVRATGRRDAANDPALSHLVADAARFVQQSQERDRGLTHVVFDAAALEEAITTAGRSVWNPERPFTIVALHPPLASSSREAARTTLEAVAIERGLPLTLAPISIVDSTGAELP